MTSTNLELVQSKSRRYPPRAWPRIVAYPLYENAVGVRMAGGEDVIMTGSDLMGASKRCGSGYRGPPTGPPAHDTTHDTRVSNVGIAGAEDRFTIHPGPHIAAYPCPLYEALKMQPHAQVWV